MPSRKTFIKRLGLVAASFYCETLYSRNENPSRFTAEVRAKTKHLLVLPERWKLIVVHHSAIKYGNAEIYGKEHTRRGMENGLAYHFVIGNGIDSKDGEIEIGPRWIRQLHGGHVHREEINKIGIGICLVGNFEETKPSYKQMIALKELIDYLKLYVAKKQIPVAVHKEIDPGRTICPGHLFPIKTLHKSFGNFSDRLIT